MNPDPSHVSPAERLAAIIESSDDAIVGKTLDGTITSWNRSAERIFGFTADEAVGQSILLIIPPERHHEEAEIIRKIMAGERIEHFETVRRHKSGRPLDISVTISPIRDQDGVVVGASKIARDVTDQKRLEALLRLAGDAAEIGLWDVDLVNDTLFWDARCKAMFGISPDVPVSMQDFYDGVHPDDRDATVQAYLAAQDSERRPSYDVEYRTIGKEDGVVRWVAAKGRGIFDHAGRCVRILGTTLDITTRKEHEAALAASEAQFRTLAQAVPNHVWAADASGASYWYNDSAYAYTGAEAGTLSGAIWRGLVHPDDWINVREAWMAAVTARGLYEAEMRIRRADGVWRWHLVRAIPVRGADGGIERWIGTNTDIHDQRAALEAFAELNANLEQRVAEALAERKLLADIVESTDAFVQISDLDYNWLGINKASADEFERIFGIRPSVGDNMLDVMKHIPEHQAEVKAVWSRALAGEEFTAIDGFGDPSLDRRYYEMKFNSLRDGDGKLIGAYQFVYDVTDRLRDQARLKQAEEQLRQSQKMEAVGQLTGGIAHDFNNMLAVVMGSLELLNRRASDDARSRHYITAALEASKRAAMLTQRLLAFSRQQPLRPEPVNANRLVAGMSELLAHALGGAIRVETVLAAGLWTINVDQNQLENVIVNLCVNARDAMPDGGKVTVECQNTVLDTRYVLSELGVPAGQYVMIAVTDTGTGMPPDVVAKAFDPFFTTKAVGKGTGLGLSQVYGFVKQSGGHIKIYSETGQGTTVKIYLPRHYTEAAAEAEKTGDGLVLRGDDQELVLIVDDEPVVRQFSVDAVAELGYRVLAAGNAEAALKLIDENPDISLLFTDIVMPDVNGRKLGLEAQRRRPGLRVLYTTGYTRNAIVHNGIVDPGVEMIGKPFTLEELAARLRSLLDG
ncbi:PAS domain S-box protein [Asticcacaulis solisilvae]|uniref:PAS domain S-box protein n=1 Tax=Asticcacaulis solisilvae TaxID=1217274 RepID=UPI003FD8BD24